MTDEPGGDPSFRSMNRSFLAALLVAALGLSIAAAAMPFLTGLLGAPILAAVFAPLHERLSTRVPARWSAAIVLLVSMVAVLLPGVIVGVVLLTQAPAVIAGPDTQRVIAEIGALRVGSFAVGTELAKASSQIATWLSREVVVVMGSATRLVVNLVIAFLGLYYLLLSGHQAGDAASRLLPFPAETVQHLRERFTGVTRATLLGIALTSLAQATIVGAAFAVVGLGHPVLWGVLTGIASILPIFGTSLVWLPGVVVLALDHRTGAAIVLAAIGVGIASNVDNVIRPIVYRRVSGMHPLTTLVGAFIGLEYFGLLGLLLGPLGLTYFFELVHALGTSPVRAEPAAAA